MSDEAALLTAIAAHPDEDTPRLMYADWLDEHGQTIRAEFIRVQIDIARKDHLPRAILNRYVDLFKRNQELIDDHRAELLGPLAALPPEVRVEFRRGFASEVDVRVEVFLATAAVLAAYRPYTRVRVSAVAARLADFVRCPHLGVVSELAAFAPAPQSVPEESELLDAAARLTRLAVLDLEGCGLADWFCDLLDNFDLPALTALDLSQNALTDIGVENLLRTHHPSRLRSLILGGNDITDAGAVALAAGWPTGDADRLEHLNLRFTNIGPTGQAALLRRFGGRVDLF